jgi:hypothetical protein
MSNQIFYISGNKKFYINENSGVLVLNNLNLNTNGNLGDSVVYTTGDQTINGNKTFSSPAGFISGLFGSQIVGFNITAPNLIYNTGNQNIGGVKNFTNNLVIQDNLLQSSQASGCLTGVGYSGNYDGGYFLGRTKLSQNTSRLVESNFGNIWVPKMIDTTRAWQSIAISSDGKYQTATVAPGFIYVSSDYGNTWTAKQTGANKFWIGASISADGKYQIATINEPTGGVYVSSDYGNTWRSTTIIGNATFTAISSDGKYQLAIGIGILYFSINYGITWGQVSSNPNFDNSNLTGISISSDGKYQTLTTNKYIYISNNYGNTWTSKMTDAIRAWTRVSISSDGKYQTAFVYNGQIYVSSDYGNSWTATETSRTWWNISMSADGKYQATVVSGGQIYISVDYGKTWTPKQNAGTNRFWNGVSISSDGKYIVAAASNNYLYISKTDEQIDGNLYADNLVYNTGNQTISGEKIFKTRPTVNGTGVLLSGEAANVTLPATIVYTTGDQTISGSKTFVNDLIVSGTGIFNALDFNNIDNLSLSGVDVTITNGKVTLTNPIDFNNIDTLNLSGIDVSITNGNVSLTNRPTVNGTGVLLSGQGIFKSTFAHADTNMNNDTYYFAHLYGLNASVNKTQRVNHIMQKCKAVFASWDTYTILAREQDSTINKCTGYFINNTTTTTGTISTQIRHTLNGTLATFTGAINPPIDINFGDQVQLALKVPSYATGMSGVINAVDVTFFY